jgi:excisionase family DNA binding protein
MSQTQEDVLTTREVMERLKVTRPTVIKLLRQGKLKAIKVGRDYRFIKSELDSFLRGETDEPKAAAR